MTYSRRKARQSTKYGWQAVKLKQFNGMEIKDLSDWATARINHVYLDADSEYKDPNLIKSTIRRKNRQGNP